MAILFFILRLIGWVLLIILLLLVVALLLPLGIQAAYRPGEAFAKAFYGPLKFTLWPRGRHTGRTVQSEIQAHAEVAEKARHIPAAHCHQNRGGREGQRDHQGRAG